MTMQSNKHKTINELLTLGILRHKNGQIMVSDNFLLVMDAEGSMLDCDLRQKIFQAVCRFVPALERQRIFTYVAMVEGYFLQN
jgi:hypothetical protein